MVTSSTLVLVSVD